MFEQGDVRVDDSFARFGGKSFAINKINSVEVRSETKPGSGTYVLWAIIALALLVAAVMQRSLGWFVFAALSAFFAWRSWERKQPTTTYRLFLVTSSSEAQAFETTDADQVEMLRGAIEDAMERSG